MKRKFYDYIKSITKNLSVKKIIGFSLVELMISLITISCICAAFAPVITKKLNKSAVAIKSGNQLVKDCSRFEQDLGGGKKSNFCKACYPSQCIVCTRTCQSNQFLNLPECKCDNCPPFCVHCTSASVCDRCQAGYYLNGSTCSKCQDKNSNGQYVCCPEGSTNQTTLCDIQNAGYIDTAGILPNNQ